MRTLDWKKSSFIILLLVLFLMSCSSSEGVREVNPDTLFASDEHEDELTIHFFNLKSDESGAQSGQAILVHTPEGNNIMIDAGKPEFGELLDKHLLEMGVDTLDYVLPSHPHSDHIGGFSTLFDTKSIGKVIDINLPLESEAYEAYDNLIEENDISVEVAKPDEVLEIEEDLEIEILAPTEEKVETYKEMDNLSAGIVNDLSMIVKLTYKDKSFLFTGDIYKGVEKDLVNAFGDELESDVVIVPHHGIGTSSSETFVDTVEANISIIASNLLMDKSVYDRYRETGSQVYVNELDGNILLTTDGETIDVYTEQERTKVEEDYINE